MDNALEELVRMGFEFGAASLALNRTNGDIQKAIKFLQSNVGEDDFDFLAQAPEEPDVHPRTIVHKNNARAKEYDEYLDVVEGTDQEKIDSRISSLTEMGFTTVQAENALEICHDDINEALTYLLQSNDKK
jgi:hypothetical protein